MLNCSQSDPEFSLEDNFFFLILSYQKCLDIILIQKSEKYAVFKKMFEIEMSA